MNKLEDMKAEYDFSGAVRGKHHEAYTQGTRLVITRGRPKAEVTKERISVRLSAEVTQYFRATGKGWQTRMDEVLKAYVEQQRSSG
ncbi:BrnA antitoxin family protein [uncultured Thiothrix sp.]|jgi:uncharacterized protein (DUF4415 family)|uniref:BrnA antitoxin family protein n=1 Tax=uncultured Thiothrix sp. TaxID=223185 RepID=UPI00261B5316|nr:BrnA antitoxin family protein [uncultured Thiothrix sp.]HMT91697.1 BrnA antitoxin family protein [Thiolinea sp.]